MTRAAEKAEKRSDQIISQHQTHQPGQADKMIPQSKDKMEDYKAAGKLKNKVALITGGDSGIGRATAIGFAKEGADIAILYLEEEKDAEETKQYIEAEGRQCLLVKGDVGEEKTAKKTIEKVIDEFGQLDILVNNAAEQHVQEDFENITQEQLERTYKTNIFSIFYMIKAALPYLKEGSAIINTASITAYKGNKDLMDYSSTKGAIVTLTRTLSQSFIEKKIRVNAVAPGPIWTPLIPSSFDAEKVAKFGKDTPMKRAGQPDEVAPAFIFLASDDASYITGQVIHPNGGTIING